LKHVGSARTEAELGVLLRAAQRLLDDPDQLVLDLGVGQRGGPAGSLLGPVSAPTLFDRQAVGVARPRPSGGTVSGTCSRVLFDAVGAVFDGIGFGALGDEVFRDLVIARIVEPTSLLDVGRVLSDLGQPVVSYSTLRRTLTRCVKGCWRGQVARVCFSHVQASGDLSLCLYDVTTLYWEAEKEDRFRKVGYSKERRVDPQILVGLLVDRRGFPLEIASFEGNTAEKHTIVPVIDAFKARHGIEHMVVVADAGMLSAANLKALDEAGYKFIVGSRATKAPIDLESHFHWHGEAFTDGQVIDTVSPKTGANTDNDKLKKTEPVWNPDKHPGSWRAVWAYSTKRAVRDRHTLTAQENKARAVVAGEKSARNPRFVTTSAGARVVNETALARARQLAGLKGYVTNIPKPSMPAAEVISSYHDLWQVEQSFRMSKTDLAARPMFSRTRDSIEAHLTIVFTALAVSREIQSRTGISIRQVVRQLRPLRSATITINGTTQTFPPEIPAEEQAILETMINTETQALGK
jgi:hypothetical protein